MSEMSADEAEIFALIMRVRHAAATHDQAVLSECWLQAPYSARWNASRVGGLFVWQGWDEISERIVQSLTDEKGMPRPIDTAEIANLNIRVSGDIGWVTFTRSYPGVPAHRAGPDAAHHIRIVERHGGRWKLVFNGFLDPGLGRPDIASIRLSADGMVIWMDAAARVLMAEQDDLVVRNGKLRLRHTGGNARLESAVRWAATHNRGMVPGRGVLPLVLEAGEGVPARIWWVIAEGGAIYFTFPPAGGHDQRLDAAAAAYNLSAAQRVVAGRIVAGLALPEIAEAMGVTVSTVRTHLDRIFEKVGVRNQTALVRVLLSAAAPL